MKYHTPLYHGWAGLLLIVWLLIPAQSMAQDYLYTDAGRVMYAEHRLQNPIKPITRGAADWNIFVRAPHYFYPFDEWNSGRNTGVWWAGYLEEILLPDASTPVTLQFYQLFSRSGIGARDAERFDLVHRVRPPIRYVGQDAIPLTNATVNVIDPNLPTNQMVVSSGVWRDGFTQTDLHWALEHPDLDRSIICQWRQHYDGRTTISAGATQDSTVYLPEGQVLTWWLGHHHLTNTCRPTNLINGSNFQNWGSSGTSGADYNGDLMEAPSRLTSPSQVQRAANLQIAYVKDAREPRITDYDGADFDDTGDPLLGPNLTTNQSAETGEFLQDDIFGTAYFHYDRNGNDKSDRFSLTDIAQNAPHAFFTTRNKGTVWGGGDWGGNTGRAEKYRTPGYERSLRRLYYDGAGGVTDGIQWTGITEGMVTGAPTAHPPAKYQKGGEWQHILCGPYTLTPGEIHDKVFTLAIADYPRKESQRLGARYLKWMAQQKPGVHPNGEALGPEVVPLSDFEKFTALETIKDSLFRVVDQSFWAWSGRGGAMGLTRDQKLAGEGLRNYPDGPPAPDIWISDGPIRCEIYAWYPDAGYFDDVDAGVDDFEGWRVYRKSGRPDVNHPTEIASFGYLDWELVADISAGGAVDGRGIALAGTPNLGADHYNDEKTFRDGTSRRVLRFYDNRVSKGTDYFYAVSAYDDGSQNTTGLTPGMPVEGSRLLAASGMFGGGIAVTPFNPGVSSSGGAAISARRNVEGLGATPFALSSDASFTMTVGRASGTVTISSAATADNLTIYDLVDDLQAAVDAAVGVNVVRVLPQRPVGKVAGTAQGSQTLGFETVQTGTPATIKISDLNGPAIDELGLNPAETRNKVIVAPNPWARDLGSGLFSGIDENKILIDNLPRLCTIKIYTETGDLITSIEHRNQSSQEFWYQQTDSGQLVKSGIYILAILEAKDVDPITNEVIGAIPDQFVKFIIIR